MRIAIAHNALTGDSRPDEDDVLVQVEAVKQAIVELGHEALTLACTPDLWKIKRQLTDAAPEVVFNLVESLEGQGRFIHFFPGLLDAMGIPYTGSCTEAIYTTSHKVLAKDRMIYGKIPTPAFRGPFPKDIPSEHECSENMETGQWLIKSLWEHGSLGLDDHATVMGATAETLDGILRKRSPELGKACFAEAFVSGREFNLSLLAGPDGVVVLPCAEIVFENFEPEKLRIVGYRAKWDNDAFEFHHTPRKFDFDTEDAPLLDQLNSIAVKCWKTFGLGGYGRVDFRVDLEGRPWVLEINTNPCLSPDAGFAAAVTEAGMTYSKAIERIIGDCVEKQEEKTNDTHPTHL